MKENNGIGHTKMCTVVGCKKTARTNSSPYCKMHYHRLYRNGTLETIRTHKKCYRHSDGYIIKHAPNHILCSNLDREYEYEHRIVFFENKGYGPFRCHWCNIPVSWTNMHIDHLDDNKTNNSILNLVSSCSRCNTTRSGLYLSNLIKVQGKFYTHNNVTLHLSEWARQLNMSHSALAWRIKNWGVEKALTKRKRN